ncbi:MAG: hypothetical protein JXA97_05165 [Anaerolineales bacterium]|nr:hypothetical protein [Anaerolineales bacterium]
MDNPAGNTAGAKRITDQIDLHAGAIDVVEAEKVTISQGGAYHVTASEVVITQGGAGTVQADTAILRNAVSLSARGEMLSVESSTIGAAVGEEVSLTDVRAGMIYADSVRSERSSSIILLSREVHGSVETVLDTRGAALAGIVAGVAVGMVLFAGSLLTRRK